MINASYKGRLKSGEYQFSCLGNIKGFLVPISGYLTDLILETPFDFSKQQNFDNYLEYEARISPLLELVVKRKNPEREYVLTVFNCELHYDKIFRDELKRVVIYDFNYKPDLRTEVTFGVIERGDVINIRTRIIEPKIYEFLKDDDIYHFSSLLKLTPNF